MPIPGVLYTFVVYIFSYRFSLLLLWMEPITVFEPLVPN